MLCRADPCLLGVVQDGENGWQYRGEEDFWKKLELFQSQPHHWARMRRRARETAGEFSAELFGARVENIYMEQIQRSMVGRVPA